MKEKVVKVIAGIVGFIAVFIVVVALTGNDAEEKTYSNSGFTITMEDGFFEKDLVTATFYYESQNAGISVIKEYFDDLSSLGIDSESSLDDYAEIVS